MMQIQDFDATSNLEITKDAGEFVVWLFDREIGRGDTVEEAIDDAKDNVRGWVE